MCAQALHADGKTAATVQRPVKVCASLSEAVAYREHLPQRQGQ